MRCAKRRRAASCFVLQSSPIPLLPGYLREVDVVARRRVACILLCLGRAGRGNSSLGEVTVISCIGRQCAERYGGGWSVRVSRICLKTSVW